MIVRINEISVDFGESVTRQTECLQVTGAAVQNECYVDINKIYLL